MKTTFGEMAQQMGNVTPIASALGVKTNELFSSLAVLTANGIQTREAVTGLKSAMSNIIKPSQQASDAAKALGIDFDASTVKTKGWLPFLTDVKDKLKEASPEFADASDKVNTLTARQNELTKSGQKNSVEYKNNANALKSAKDQMSALEQSSNSQLSAFATMFGSVEGLNSILTLTSDQGISLYNDGMRQMQDGSNLTDDAFNKVNDTAGNRLKKSLNELKNSAINLGDAAEPLLEDTTNLLDGLAKVLQNTDKGTLKFIEDIGLATLGFGLLTKGLGIAVGAVGTWKTVIGGIAGLIGNITTASATATVAAGATAEATAGVGAAAGVASVGIGGLAIAAAPWILAGAAIVAAGVGIHHVLTQQTAPAVDLFNAKIEEHTQTMDNYGNKIDMVSYKNVAFGDSVKKNINAYLDLDNGAKKSLTDLYINSTTITDQTVTDMKTKYDSMATQIKAGMDKHYNDEYQTMQQFYQKSNVLADTQEQASLAKLQSDNANKKAQIDTYEQQILSIMNNASLQHRSLTQQEQQQINDIQGKMRDNAVNALSDNEVQSKVILQRIKDYGTNITAQQAGDIIKNANSQRDGAVNAANDQYNKTVAAIILMRDGTHSITSDQADKLIADAKRQKDESVQKAEEMRSEVVTKVSGMNKDVTDNVNTSTGNILTIWDKLKNWWDSWQPGGKTMTVTTVLDNNQPAFQNPVGKWNGNLISQHASGTDYFEGGLTTLHEKGYEVYSLPTGTKIYNHDASEDLVKKTAESVANSILAKSQTQPISTTNNKPVNITMNGDVYTQDKESVTNTLSQLAFMASF